MRTGPKIPQPYECLSPNYERLNGLDTARRQGSKRLFAEVKTAAAQEYRSAIPQLVREAITTRQEQQADVSGYSVSVTVGGDPADSAYIGIAIVGRVESADHAVILKQVPGTDPSAWFVDRMPHRDAKAGEVVWSNFLEADYVEEVLLGGH